MYAPKTFTSSLPLLFLPESKNKEDEVMNIPSREKVESIRKTFPIGTRVKCLTMRDDPRPIPSGTEGTVTLVDDIGNIHTRWDNGSSLALVPEVDDFIIVSKGGGGNYGNI